MLAFLFVAAGLVAGVRVLAFVLGVVDLLAAVLVFAGFRSVNAPASVVQHMMRNSGGGPQATPATR